MKKAICVLLLLLLAGCRNLSTNVPTAPAATVSMSPTADPTGEGDAHAAEYAFSFTAQTLDGAEMTEAAFSEHDLTMVNVWASWCPPCRGGAPGARRPLRAPAGKRGLFVRDGGRSWGSP